jgi:RNA polymerase-binding transcription factor DksA
MIQSLIAAGQDNARRGDLVDQASLALEVDTKIRVAVILSAEQAEAGAKQMRNKDGRIICGECEEPISEKRLKARPKAVLCTDCKAKRDPEFLKMRS